MHHWTSAYLVGDSNWTLCFLPRSCYMLGPDDAFNRESSHLPVSHDTRLSKLCLLIHLQHRVDSFPFFKFLLLPHTSYPVLPSHVRIFKTLKPIYSHTKSRTEFPKACPVHQTLPTQYAQINLIMVPLVSHSMFSIWFCDIIVYSSEAERQ